MTYSNTGYINLIYLGKYADVDPYENDWDSEHAHNLEGLTVDHTDLDLVSVRTYDANGDGVVQDNDFGTSDSVTYTLNGQTCTFKTDSSLQGMVEVTLTDGSVRLIEVVLIQTTNGDLFLGDLFNNGEMDNLEIASIEIVDITGNCYSGFYSNQSVDNTSFGPVVQLDGTVEGTAGDDLIDTNYTGDPDGDRVDAEDNILAGRGPNDDLIVAGAGDDSVLAGVGNDEVYGGDGADTLDGGAGNDLLAGEGGDDSLTGGAGNDVIYGDDPTPGPDSVRESFEWNLLTEGQIDSTASQDTGNVTVTYTRIQDTGEHFSRLGDTTLNTTGVDGGGETVDPTSSLHSETSGQGNQGDFQWVFSDPVTNVSFNVNDIDGDGVVRITAYDADGNKIPVTLTAGSGLTLLDTDSVAGADTADSKGGYADTNTAPYTLNVSIAGPVSKIVLEHDQNGPNNSGIDVTDIYFDADTSGEPGGNDVIDGGDGDDLIYGQEGDDQITGGAGADAIYGGDDQDYITGGTAGDVVDGGTDGVDNDTLDLRDSGPLRVVNETVDADGDSTSGTIEFLDADGNVTGTMTFTEIENLLLPENTGPDAVNDSFGGGEDDAPQIIGNVLDNDTDAETPGDLSVTEVNGDAGNVGQPVAGDNGGLFTINPDGTVSFDPNGEFDGLGVGDSATTTITYTISDGQGGSDTATVTFVVEGANDDPVATDDPFGAGEDDPAAVIGNVLDNDSDVDGDPLTVTEVGGDAGNLGQPVAGDNGGLITIGPDGSVSFDPNGDFEALGEGETATTTITYTVSDGQGGTDTATVTITVTGANDGPTAVMDAYDAGEDDPAAVIGNVLGNDTDPESDPLSVTEVNGDAANVGQPVAGDNGGLVTIGPDGAVSFDPNGDFEALGAGETAETTVTYTISDPDGETSTTTVTITVTGVNDGPDATDNAYVVSLTEGAGDVDGNVITDDTGAGRDSDPESDPLKVVAVAGAAAAVGTAVAGDSGGLFTINEDGSVDFDANGEFGDLGLGETRDTSVTYTISDGNGGFDTATTTFTVTGINDGTVQGTAGDDVINPTIPYVDGDGDIVDANDAILPGDSGNDDLILGFEGNDSIAAGDGNDEVFGGTGNDVIRGDAGNDTLSGDDGNDMVFGGIGDDTLYGGAGDDKLEGAGGSDLLEGGDGNDDIWAGSSDDTVFGGAGDDTINGGGQNDLLVGGSGDDVIDGGNGDDSIRGGDGEDVITGDTGNDTINGGDDNDLIDGGDGDDTLAGNQGDDTILGGAGDDEIAGNTGDDVIDGGIGNDDITAGQGSDVVEGGDGDDVINAGNHADPATDYDYPGDTTLGLPIGDNDPDPTNDLDTVFGGAGNDTITTGDDDDYVDGGTGDDFIDVGIDDDTVIAGAGNDTVIGSQGSDLIEGNDGDDLIYGGLESEVLQLPDEIDPAPDDNIDTIFGGAGNDTIFGRDDDDILFGGSGDDYIDGGIDEDEIQGGDGNDTLVGGQGNDSMTGNRGDDTLFGGDGDDFVTGGIDGNDEVYGGDGNDTVLGGIGDDTLDGGEGDDIIAADRGDDLIFGGGGNDSIQGGVDNDTIFGGDGDDTIRANDGDDVVEGGAGDDFIVGGEGADQLSGGDDRDLFKGITAGDVVDGGTGGDDFDTLDLRGLGPLRVVNQTVDPDGDSTSGTVEFLDADGNVTGTMTFAEIENVIPCFTPGTTIATPRGERLVEELQVGDKIITRDNGIQEIAWVGHKEMAGTALARNPHLKPILIRAGALGGGLPERDMIVSPNHRVLVASEKTQLYFEEREVLAAAKHMTGAPGISAIDTMRTTYIHFMFERHEVVLSNGAWTESFQPGDYSLKGIGNSQRNEIFELFPELKSQQGLENYQSARKALKKHEARLLLK